MRYVYGNRERLFVNTALGCKAKCKYCYLPNIKNGVEVEYISAETAIELVENSAHFIKGEEGTILSIGCYSECLDDKNILETKAVLEYFLPMGNYVQLATKQEIPAELLDVIIEKRAFKEQVSIFVSMPTISEIAQLESGTAPAQVRISNIVKCKKSGIFVALYIKPFLERVTAKDKELYIQIIKEHEVPVIIGSYLSVKKSEKQADVGENILYEQKQSTLYEQFISEFKEIPHNYKHSVEFIEYLKQLRRETNGR